MRYLFCLLLLCGCDSGPDVDQYGITVEMYVNRFSTAEGALSSVKKKLNVACLRAGYEGLEEVLSSSSIPRHGNYDARGIGKCKGEVK